MKVLLVGRDQAMMNTALKIAASFDHEPTGVLTDDNAIHEIESGVYAAVTIGGGVEPASRKAIKVAAGEHNTIALDVFGPDDLGNQLKRFG